MRNFVLGRGVVLAHSETESVHPTQRKDSEAHKSRHPDWPPDTIPPPPILPIVQEKKPRKKYGDKPRPRRDRLIALANKLKREIP